MIKLVVTEDHKPIRGARSRKRKLLVKDEVKEEVKEEVTKAVVGRGSKVSFR